jgi:hypothetical protein
VNLLKAALYDPAGAVSKATSALLAMTALDTVNLRLAITVPAHGMVLFKARVAIVGAATPPVILLGVMNGVTVIARVTPLYTPVTAPAATQVFLADMECTVSGLAAGAMNVDLAYAVQVVVAATNIKYGGPNTNAGANAWGAAVFEAWDPQPQTANSTLAVDASGRVDIGKWIGVVPAALTATGKYIQAAMLRWLTDDAAGTPNALATGDVGANVKQYGGVAGNFAAGRPEVNTTHVGGTLQTAGDIMADTNDIQARLPAALVGGRMDSSTGAMAANVITAAAAAADFGTEVGTAVWATAARSLTDKAGFNVSSIDANVITAASMAADAGVEIAGAVWASAARTLTANPGLDAAAVRAAVGLAAANLDAQLDALPTAAEIRLEMDANSADFDTLLAGVNAVFARTDVATSSRLADAAYTAPDNAGIAGIKAKTDGLTFTTPGTLDVQILIVNGVRLAGSGTLADPMRAA